MTLTNNFNEDNGIDNIQPVIPKKDEVMNTMDNLDIDKGMIITAWNNHHNTPKKYHH